MADFIVKLSLTIKAFSDIYLFWQLDGTNKHSLETVKSKCQKFGLMVVEESSHRIINQSYNAVAVAYRSEPANSKNESMGPKNNFLKVVSGPLNNEYNPFLQKN